MTIRQWALTHVSALSILIFALSIIRIGPVVQVEEPLVPTYNLSIASGDITRGTLSVRIADYPPRVVPTPRPAVPVAIPLPPPPVVGSFVNPIVGSGVLSWPVRSRRITTYFSASHQAIDIGVPCGTPVVASTTGIVTYAGWKNNGGGLVIDVTGYNGFGLTYDHLSVVGVGTGVEVAAGQIIGASGATGWAKGCHLHFGVYLNGVQVNPLLYL